MPQKAKAAKQGTADLTRTVREVFVDTPAGVFTFEMTSKGLYRVRFPRKISSPRDPISGGKSPAFLRRFNGPSVLSYGFSLDLSGCTSFQRKISAQLRKVPVGKTVTYGELARRAGFPGAARAVGSAMRRNRIPIVIPCHRVIPAAGGLGEYSAGRQWKRWLLQYEMRDSSLGTWDSKISEEPERAPRRLSRVPVG